MSGFNQNLLVNAAVGALESLVGGSVLNGTGYSGPRTQTGSYFGEYLRDYTHASKIFRTNSYQNTPKFKYLFHTYFKINTEAMQFFNGGRSGTNVLPTSSYGLLVKDIKLPSFNITTHQLNQYNRKRIVQTKIKYEPVEVSFHDDNGDTINGMWQAYYQYYYQDSLNVNAQFNGARGGNGGAINYNQRNIYDNNIGGDNGWGYDGTYPNGTQKKIPFFDSITVFGFNQHNFTAYTFINPLITNFSHDNYSYNETNGIMQNRMTFDYETVTYDFGHLDGQDPSNIIPGGFGQTANYDTTPSPIMAAGANKYALGQGGLVPSLGGALTQQPAGSTLAAAQTAGVSYASLYSPPNPDPSAALNAGAVAATAGVTSASSTRNVSFNIPALGSTGSTYGTGTANYPVINGATAPTPITNEPLAGQQNNSADLTPSSVGQNQADFLDPTSDAEFLGP